MQAGYRLSREEILSCCENGYQLGFRTFVLQGGEDPAMTDDRVMEMVQAIRAGFPDCAITLSLGEKKYDTLKRWKEAGADRYLLRHETADACHYASLHPAEMSFEHRMQCLRDLKALGYQTGCGFMVGSPHRRRAVWREICVLSKNWIRKWWESVRLFRSTTLRLAGRRQERWKRHCFF